MRFRLFLLVQVMFVTFISAEIHTYLQSPTPNSIYVSWLESSSTGSTVEFGTSSSLGKTKTGTVTKFSSSIVWHIVKLTGLEPNTYYYYKAVSGSKSSAVKRFKTLPKYGSSEGHVRFIVYGDNRTDAAEHNLITKAMVSKVTELYGKNIESSINCVLNNGDIVYAGGDYDRYRDEYFNCIYNLSENIPFMVSIGNHESYTNGSGQATFSKFMAYEDFAGPQGEMYYSFKIARCLFIAINTDAQGMGSTQIKWLDGLLKNAESDNDIDWVFAFEHHPGHSEMWPNGNNDWVQDYVIPTLSKYKKVDLLAYGHSHNYERGAVENGNLRLMLSGGGGASLDNWGEYNNQQDYPEIQKSFDHYNYSIFDVDLAKKKMSMVTYSLGNKKISYNNTAIDSFFRDKSSGATKPEIPSVLSYKYVNSGGVSTEIKSSDYYGKYKIMSSQILVTKNKGDYNSVIINQKRDYEDIYGETSDHKPIDLNKGIDLTKYSLPSSKLTNGNTYYCIVRYRDRNLQWSDWSKEVAFVVGKSLSSINNGAQRNFAEISDFKCTYNMNNSLTKIRFNSPLSQNISVSIFDIKGNLVKRFSDKNMKIGMNELVWDGKSNTGNIMGTGVYTVKLQSKTLNKSAKVSIVK